MINKTNNNKLNFLINVTYILYISIIIYFLSRYAFKLFFPFIIAIIIGVILEPFVQVINNKLKIKRYIASLFCILTFYLVIFVISSLLWVILIDNIKDFYAYFPELVDSLKNATLDLAAKNNSELLIKVSNAFLNYVSNIDIFKTLSGNLGTIIIKQLSGFIKSIPSFSLSILITIISSLFVSVSFQDIKKFILAQLNYKNQNIIRKIKTSATSLIKKYLKSYALIMLITFCELALLFTVFEIKPSLILALIISLIDILPVFGIGIVIIPWAIYCMITNNINKGIILLSIYLLITVIRQIIEPKIVGDSIGLNPLITLISIYIGFKLFGILGIISTPIAVTFIVELNTNNTIKLWRNLSIDN